MTVAEKPESSARRVLGLAALVGLGGVGFVGWIAPAINNGPRVEVGLAVSYIVVAMLMGVSLVWAMRRVDAIPQSRVILMGVVLVGLSARLLLVGSEPVLEDDWYRYLWDGAVVTTGTDPYTWAPAEAVLLENNGGSLSTNENSELSRLREMAQEAAPYPQRVNYPFVKTIYPPVAQLGFALAAMLKPFSLDAWRLILLGADLLALGLGLWALKAHGRSRLWIIGYWWNPVVILQGFNGGHMDILVVPAVFALVGLVARPRPKLAMAVLALATAIKIWPALWLPVVVKSQGGNWKRALGLVLGFLGLALILMYPQIRHWSDPDQGLVVYAADWRRHAFLFGVLVDGILTGFANPGQVARWLVGGLVVAVSVGMTLRLKTNKRGVVTIMAVSLLALLLLSPTGYPWYLIWGAPLWCFLPWRGLSALMVLAPLYVTRFVTDDDHLLYNGLVVPIAFGVPLVFFLWDWWATRTVGEIGNEVGEPDR